MNAAANCEAVAAILVAATGQSNCRRPLRSLTERIGSTQKHRCSLLTFFPSAPFRQLN